MALDSDLKRRSAHDIPKPPTGKSVIRQAGKPAGKPALLWEGIGNPMLGGDYDYDYESDYERNSLRGDWDGSRS